ncbi:putative butyrate kinase [Labeo rohita]|uniref:Butyrate kinase n=1 Tax=Labeo rohita TaxID=84645 RepID=A0ABQ8LPM7_LABRO|nr:putative butyrate kinase [Labeo rohita]
MSLHDMLEIKTDLTFSHLSTILKGHYKEEGSTDLYHRLINVTQESRKSPQNFLFRATELKERLLAAAREPDGEESNSPDLKQKRFLHALGAGLSNNHIKYQLKAYFDDPTVTDEVPITKMNKAASLEWECQQKFKINVHVKETKVTNTEKGSGDAVGVRSMVEVTSVAIFLNMGKVGIFPEGGRDHLHEEQKEGTQLVAWQ